MFASPEEEWRHDCLAFARVKNLQVVEDMHAFYLVINSTSLDLAAKAAAPIVSASCIDCRILRPAMHMPRKILLSSTCKLSIAL